MTTWLPGASDVLTHGLTDSPRASALRATSPAASMTDGFEVLVQLVIAAITMSPSLKRWGRPSTGIDRGALTWTVSARVRSNDAATPSRGTRSCGRFGPARLGWTVPRSSSSVSVKTGAGVVSSCQSPWALA